METLRREEQFIARARMSVCLQVIGRIFYVVDRNWNGRLSPVEVRRSVLLQTLRQLEDEPDINQVGVANTEQLSLGRHASSDSPSVKL